MIYFKDNLPLPPLPLKFEKALVTIQKSQRPNNTHYFSGQGEFKFKQLPDIVYKWVNENICDDYTGLGVQSIENGDFDPHIDGHNPSDVSERHYTILYMIETGGDTNGINPYTRFYKTNSDSVIPLCNIRNNKLYDRNDVTVVTEHQFKKHTWNLINNQCIHSVDNITSTRICLAINFYNPRPQSLVNMGLI